MRSGGGVCLLLEEPSTISMPKVENRLKVKILTIWHLEKKSCSWYSVRLESLQLG